MAPARSIQCMRRPPSRAASGLASLGSTISAISDCESRTGRGVRASVIHLPLHGVPVAVFRSSVLFQVRLQETFGHFLDAGIVVTAEPGCSREIKFQFTLGDMVMFAFANVHSAKNAIGRVGRRHGAQIATD